MQKRSFYTLDFLTEHLACIVSGTDFFESGPAIDTYRGATAYDKCATAIQFPSGTKLSMLLSLLVLRGTLL